MPEKLPSVSFIATSQHLNFFDLLNYTEFVVLLPGFYKVRVDATSHISLLQHHHRFFLF